MHARNVVAAAVAATMLTGFGTEDGFAAPVRGSEFGSIIGRADREVERYGSSVVTYAGWTAWTRRDGERRRLQVRHKGTTFVAQIAGFPGVISMDIGPGPSGPALVYPRCPTRPAADRSGCDIYRFDLASRRELRVTTSPPNGSDTAAAIWRGNLAFSRKVEGDPSKSGVFLRRGNKLVRVGRPSPTGRVSGLDLRGEVIAFTATYEAQRCRDGSPAPSADLPDAGSELWVVRDRRARRVQWGCSTDPLNGFAVPFVRTTRRIDYAFNKSGDPAGVLWHRTTGRDGTSTDTEYSELPATSSPVFGADASAVALVDRNGDVRVGGVPAHVLGT